MAFARRLPVLILSVMVVLVTVVSGNLSGLGIGRVTLLYDSIALPRLVIAATLVLAAWAAWFLFARKDEGIRVDLVWGLLGGLALWSLLSAALSPHRVLAVLGQSERLEGAVTVMLYAMLYGIGLQVLRNERAVRLVVSCLAGAAIWLSAYGMAQYAGIDLANYSVESYGFNIRRAFATFGNPNFFAGLLVLALPVVVALAVSGTSRFSRWAWSGGALLVLGALFATFTRGAWLAVAVEALLGVVIWLRVRRGPVPRNVKLGIGAAAAILMVLGILSLGAPSELNVATRVAGAFNRTESASERSFLVGIASSASAARPLVGYGPDTFLPAFRLHRSDAYVLAFPSTATMNNAHSWPFQYAVTLGLVGVVMLMAAISVAFSKSRRLILAPASTAGGIVSAGVWLGCLGFVVSMLFGVGTLGATVPFWLLLGTLAASDTAEKPVGTIARRAAGVLFAVVCAAAVAASFALISADASYLRARRAYVAGDYRTAAVLAERARALNPLSVKYARGTADARGELVYEAMRKGSDASTVRALYLSALADYQRMLSLDANDYPARAWLGALQASTGLYLSDERLLSDSAANVALAAALDRHHSEVVPLMRSTDQGAIQSAGGVPRLP